MKEIVVEMKGSEWTDLLDHVFEHKKKDLKIDGFRKGNVPKDVYVKKFGIESLFMDAVDHAIPTLYDKMIKENKDLDIACRPSVDVKTVDKEHLEVIFKITEKPEVKLGEYKNLGIKKEEVTVSEEEVLHELEHLKEQFVELKDKTTGKVEDGDEAIIDFEGFKDGIPFDGGQAKDYNLVIGSNSFIPGFEEALIGMNIGEEKDINLTFPENYHSEELKGKEVVFKVKINGLKTRVYPEYNEDFFKDLNIPEVDTLEKLKEDIKKHISAHKEMHVEDEYFEKCLSKVSDNAKIDVPEEMINEEMDRIIHEFSDKLQMQGMNFETYLKMLGMDRDKFTENFKPEAVKRVRYRLVLEEIVKKEDIKISEKALNDYSKEMASKYNMEESKFLEEIGGKEFLEYDLKVKKALEIVTK